MTFFHNFFLPVLHWVLDCSLSCTDGLVLDLQPFLSDWANVWQTTLHNVLTIGHETEKCEKLKRKSFLFWLCLENKQISVNLQYDHLCISCLDWGGCFIRFFSSCVSPPPPSVSPLLVFFFLASQMCPFPTVLYAFILHRVPHLRRPLPPRSLPSDRLWRWNQNPFFMGSNCMKMRLPGTESEVRRWREREKHECGFGTQTVRCEVWKIERKIEKIKGICGRERNKTKDIKKQTGTDKVERILRQGEPNTTTTTSFLNSHHDVCYRVW